jgi:HD-like signal output (HDOD) protein
MISLKIVEIVDDLPTLPASFQAVRRVAEDPLSSSSEIAEIVEKDQVLTAKALRLINSAFYGMPRKITRVEQAITLIGINALKNLILGSSVFQVFGKKAKLKKLWIHAVATAVAAKVIGQNILYREIEELFICGLLHDIGKVVEYQYYPKDVEIAAEKCKVEKRHYFDVEKELFGIGHERIGQLLLKKWRLPEKFSKVAGFHHHPNLRGDYALEIGIVFVADALVRHMKLGDTWDANMVPKVGAENLKLVGLRKLGEEKIMNAINEQVEEVIQVFITD